MDNKTFQYKIDKITPGEFIITPKPADFSISKDDCDVTLSIQLTVPEQLKVLRINLMITYIDKRNKEQLAKYEVITDFGIIDFDQVMVLKENVVNVPNTLIADGLSICIGTSRGLILYESKNTYLAEIYLPVYNIGELLKQLVKGYADWGS